MNAPQPNSFRNGPDERGFFGIYGGRFVAETLMPLILELEQAYEAAKADPAFRADLLISGVRPIEGVVEALRSMIRKEALKVVIRN